LALVYSFVLLPQSRLIEAKEQGLAGERQAAGLTGSAGRDEAGARLREQIETSTGQLRDFLVDLAGSAEVVSDVGRISDAIGLSSFNITDSGDDNAPVAWTGRGIGERSMDVSFAGSYSKFAAFLNALERRRPAIFVDTFRITRSALGASNHKVNMRLPILVEDLAGPTISPKIEESDGEQQTVDGAADATTIEIGVGVGPIKFGMSGDQVMRILGKPDKIEGNGVGLNYAASRGLSMAVSRYRGVLRIDCWSAEIRAIAQDSVSTFEGATKEGIGMNATYRQIRTAYGKPDKAILRGPTMTLHYEGLRAQFVLMNSRLVNLRMFAPKQ
jgi:hypothetical protein